MTNKFVLLTFWQIAWINSCQVSILKFISYFVFTHIIIGMKPKKFHKKTSTSRKEEKISQKNTMPKTEEKILLFAYILKIQRRPNNIAFKVSIYVKLCFTKLFFFLTFRIEYQRCFIHTTKQFQKRKDIGL